MMHRPRGFTLVEIALAIALTGIVAAVGLPRVAELARRTRVTNASHLVAADLDLALSLATRQRHAVRLVYDPGATRYAMTDLVTGAVLQRRSLGADSEWRLESVRFAPDTIDLSPVGIASAPVSVSLAAGSARRLVTMTRTGIVREVVP
jgi:prepilin-type N-terminal cleavage/methylation domain-containing protein